MSTSLVSCVVRAIGESFSQKKMTLTSDVGVNLGGQTVDQMMQQPQYGHGNQAAMMGAGMMMGGKAGKGVLSSPPSLRFGWEYSGVFLIGDFGYKNRRPKCMEAR
jgi:hypothetical protein